MAFPMRGVALAALVYAAGLMPGTGVIGAVAGAVAAGWTTWAVGRWSWRVWHDWHSAAFRHEE